MKIIAPSILAADFKNLEQQIRYAEMGGAGIIHCDVMDGHFVPNLTIGPFIVEAANRSTELPLDVHLMVENPDDLLEAFVKSGADYLTVHQEAVIHLHRTVERIKELGVKAGVSIHPSTPVETLSEILEFVDMVLIMSVNPGFVVQKFILSSLKKIAKLKKLREEMSLNFSIEIDCGVDIGNIQTIAEAGCDIFVDGSSVFMSENISAVVMDLKFNHEKSEH